MGEIARIGKQLERTYSGDPWHGPSLRSVLEGIDGVQANARPVPGAHSIAELAAHILTWREETLRRLEGKGGRSPGGRRLAGAHRVEGTPRAARSFARGADEGRRGARGRRHRRKGQGTAGVLLRASPGTHSPRPLPRRADRDPEEGTLRPSLARTPRSLSTSLRLLKSATDARICVPPSRKVTMTFSRSSAVSRVFRSRPCTKETMVDGLSAGVRVS